MLQLIHMTVDIILNVGARPNTWVPAWGDVTGKPSTFPPSLGTTSSTAFRGDYGNTAYAHSQAAHAPTNAQKNSDITKAEIEAKLTGDVTTHTHDGRYYTEAEVNNLLSGKASSSHTHNYAGSSSAGGSANSAVKLATVRSLTIGSVSKNFDGTGNVSWSLSEIGASRGKNASATTPATAGWYRIAQTTNSDQANNIAIFQIQGAVSSNHASAIITAGISYGKTPVMQQISYTNFGSGLTQARIVYHTTYTGNRAYLEVYLNTAAVTTINVQMFGDLGWTLLSPNTVGSVPTGYTTKTINFASDSMISDHFIGNASTASKLATARTLSITGHVTGSATFDGSANASISATLANSGVTAGNYGPGANATPGHSGSFTVPYITVDAKGRVTAAATRTITLPADSNTDTKVTNTLATTTKAYVTGTTSATTNTGTQVFDTGVYLDATAGKLVATTFQGSLAGNASSASSATKATQDSAGQQINTTYIKGLSVSGRTITYTKGDGTTGSIITQDTNTTYSTGTATAPGLTKLYTGTGTATDGTMTQAAINAALGGKANSSHGTHVSYGGNGSATTVSRSDHSHPAQTSVSGNAGTATTLQTARTINGTSFNGSANITTANWGTARTLTVGNTGKSVNGAGNVSWSLSEIGAAAASHNHKLGDLHVIDPETKQPIGNSSSTPLGTIYARNNAKEHSGRYSCYHNVDTGTDYTSISLYNLANKANTSYVNIYPTYVYTNKSYHSAGDYIQLEKISLRTSAPSSPKTGDIWIDV